MKLRIVALLVTCVCALPPSPSPLGAQTDVPGRLAGRVSPQVAAAVQQLAREAVARGLPVEPLIQKAVEGGAKGVPAERVVAAVRTLLTRLDAAAAAIRSAGVAVPDAAAVEAGAFALGAGLGSRHLGALARASRPPHALDVTLRVAGTLAAMGVPDEEAVALVTQILQAGRLPLDVLTLPAQVQAGVARGATPAEAAAGLARAAGAAGRAVPPQPAVPADRPPRPSPPRP